VEPLEFTYFSQNFPLVSHLKERKEKICLNCQSALYGRYCHVCGQENLEPKETVWHLVQHFFNDITHFDGKFFSSVKYLVRKPGFLSREYMLGRRASYLNPIRMYVFTSAIFFIIFFSLQSPEKVMKFNETPEVKKNLPTLIKDRAVVEKEMKEETDKEDKQDLIRNLQKRDAEIAMIKKEYGDTTTRSFSKSDRALLLAEAITNDSLGQTGLAPLVRDNIKKSIEADKNNQGTNFFDIHPGRYGSVEQYDSLQKTLPDSLRDGWFRRAFSERLIEVELGYHRDKKSWQQHLAENFLHSFPKILFWSLPFFALILNMLYFRRKQYFYVDHGIFTIHVYCANFILILIMVLLSKLANWLQWGWLEAIVGILIFLICLYMLIYLYKAMRGFYQQRRAKTFLKYCIACFLAFIVNLIIMLIFLLISVISIH